MKSLSSQDERLPVIYYMAAGGVVIHKDKVLVLNRPAFQEVRLPKGHIEPGELASEAALREVAEESGYFHLQILTDLGEQIVAFDHQGFHIVRTEQYFLMALTARDREQGEDQFEPLWLTWEAALQIVTFQAEREWIHRAKHAAD